jgi:hypothetical protein
MEKRMKRFDHISLFILAALLFTACSPSAKPTGSVIPGNNPYAPQTSDNAMTHGDVRINSTFLDFAQSQPPQVLLNIAYYEPTPCYQLRVIVYLPDSQNRVNVSAYAVAEKDKLCTLTPLNRPLQASLNIGSYPKGHYSVYVNGIKAGEFDS